MRVVATQKQFTVGSLQVTDQTLDMALMASFKYCSRQVKLPTPRWPISFKSRWSIGDREWLVAEPNIAVPEGANHVTIGMDGTVTATIEGDPNPQNLGTIDLVDFINPAGLQAVGGNLFVQTGSSGDPINGIAGENGMGAIQQGMLENSNVDIVQEMVNMITTQRAYEMNSKVVSTADQMLQFITQNV